MLSCLCLTALPAPCSAAQETAAPAGIYSIYAEATTVMHRLYNPNSGEHFYTSNTKERDHLEEIGWNYEGVGWIAPERSSRPVYRLYNPNAGDHHYTMEIGERNHLVSVGWKDEGIGWYSDTSNRVPMYRQYNPNAKAGSHNYTRNKAENDSLVRAGWRAEGIGWYAVGEIKPQGDYGTWSAGRGTKLSIDSYNSFDAAWYRVQNRRMYRDAITGSFSEPVKAGEKTWRMTVTSCSKISTDYFSYPPDAAFTAVYREDWNGFKTGDTIYFFEQGLEKWKLPASVRSTLFQDGAEQSPVLEHNCLYDETADVVIYEGQYWTY